MHYNDACFEKLEVGMANKSKQAVVQMAFAERLRAGLPEGKGEIAEIARLAGVSDPTARLHLRNIVANCAMMETAVLTTLLNELEIVMTGGRQIEVDLRMKDDAGADKARADYMAVGRAVNRRIGDQNGLLISLLEMEQSLVRSSRS
jgi:hypothetical protein